MLTVHCAARLHSILRAAFRVGESKCWRRAVCRGAEKSGETNARENRHHALLQLDPVATLTMQCLRDDALRTPKSLHTDHIPSRTR